MIKFTQNIPLGFIMIKIIIQSILIGLLLSGCNFNTLDNNATSSGPENNETSVELVTTLLTSSAGSTIHTSTASTLTNTASYTDSTTQNVSTSSTFVSSDTSVATVNAHGVVSSISAGSVTITATYGGIDSNFSLTVIEPLVLITSIQSNAGAIMHLSTLAQLTNIVRYTDNTTQNITTLSTWESNDTSRATVDSNGQITALAEGNVTITANYMDMNSSYNITITNPDIAVVVISSSSGATIHKATATQLTNTATYTDGTKSDITALTTWLNSDDTIAVVNNQGLVVGISTGITTITSSYMQSSATYTLTIKESTLNSTTLTSEDSTTVQIGDTAQLHNTANFSDGTQDVTVSTTWSSSNELVATVNSEGTVATLNEGNVMITALYNGLESRLSLLIHNTSIIKLDSNLTVTNNTIWDMLEIEDLRLRVEMKTTLSSASQRLNHADAIRYCTNLSIGTQNSWRLPTSGEFGSLSAIYNRFPEKFIIKDSSVSYWTSSVGRYSSYSYYGRFDTGISGNTDNTTLFYTICVHDY